MSRRSRGNKRERQAREFYESAGFEVERSNGSRYGRSDWFGLIDLMAVHPDCRPRFIQVKSNEAKGITKWIPNTTSLFPMDHVELDFLVAYKREGWRYDAPVKKEDGTYGYATVVDEREHDCNMGEKIEAYLADVIDSD